PSSGLCAPHSLDGGLPPPTDGGSSASGLIPFPGAPQVVTEGGPVLTAPVFVPIFFSNDDPTTVTSIADFDARVGATDYWKAISQEYGVGPASSVAPVMLAETAIGTMTDEHIQDWLSDRIHRGLIPGPTANSLYL